MKCYRGNYDFCLNYHKLILNFVRILRTVYLLHLKIFRIIYVSHTLYSI